MGMGFSCVVVQKQFRSCAVIARPKKRRRYGDG
jgi:hypothetical protein